MPYSAIFDFEGLFKHFQIGEDSYRAFIDSKFKLSFFDEDNKALKTLPSRASAELKETFKEIAKEVRDVVKSQSSRLEHYLVVQRSWMLGAWRSTFLENPIMFIYATRLLWIVYVDGKLQGCFICQEDTTLVDLEDEEFAVTGNAEVRIAHPILMPDALLQAWKRKFFDLSIESIFPQLDRPVYKLSDADRAKKIIQDFAGKAAVPGAIRGTLERCGWRKGESEDGGSIRVFHFLDYSGTIEAVLEVDGVFAWGFDGDVDPALGRLYFLQAEAGRKGWFNTPTNEADERLIALGDIAPTLYSEVLAAVHSIKLKDAGASA